VPSQVELSTGCHPERDSITQGRVRRYKASVDTSDFVNGLNATNLSPARWSRRRSRCRTLRIPGVRCPRCSGRPANTHCTCLERPATVRISTGRRRVRDIHISRTHRIPRTGETHEYRIAGMRRFGFDLTEWFTSNSVAVDREHNTCSVGIVAFRMPMRERTYVCEPFLRYLPG
jgi:hypothetical protein